ncbi:hypothetical protein NL676_031799 [Syzygium grande]|nr:hypothetical protein NL676_031799 [Syzygium grande]
MHGVVAKVKNGKKEKGGGAAGAGAGGGAAEGAGRLHRRLGIFGRPLLPFGKRFGVVRVCPVFDPIASFVHRIQSSIVTAGAVVVVVVVVTKGDKWSWSRALPSPHTWCRSPTARPLALVVGGCSIRSVRWEHATEAR